MASGKYNSVFHISCSVGHKHDATTDEAEYFAESTEAFFWKNDYYPLNNMQLYEFDPDMY